MNRVPTGPMAPRQGLGDLSTPLAPRLVAAVLPFVLLSGALARVGQAAEPDGPAAADGGPRPAWTTSKVVGSPDPPSPYRAERVFPQLQFNRPVVLTSWTVDQRMFVAEQGGKIFVFDPQENDPRAKLVVDLKQLHPQLTAVYGLTFHPRVDEQPYLYVCYITGRNDEAGTRVVRLTLEDLKAVRLDPASEQLLVTWFSGGHNGGCLKFGPDGYLYISTGDASGPSPPDTKRAGQDVSNLLSSILRIDVDRAEQGRAYRIPEDNPLRGIPGARPEVWAYGFRNPWKFSFDRATGELWVGDVGWELWEMVYRVEKGGNYGWSIMEGPQVVLPEQEPGPTPILPPTIAHPHSEAASITGGFVYRGQRLPELQGAYVYGDYQSGILWGARVEGKQLQWQRELARSPVQLVGFGEDREGELYLLDYQGPVYRLARNEAADRSRDFPRKLSDTGLFASVAEQLPAAGVVSYEINAPHWADHTYARRWLAVPGDGRLAVDAKGNWQFPEGSVVVKTVSMRDVIEPGQTPRTRHLETQILHREGGSWHPYTFAWNAQQTDAELVEDDWARAGKLTRRLKVRDADQPGGIREQIYQIATRQECVLCHNPWVEAKTTIFGAQSASLLGVTTAQLHRQVEAGGRSLDQFELLRAQELLSADPATLKQTAPLVDPYDDRAELAARARAYLHVNCAHCHQFNAGGVATIALGHDVPLNKTGTLDARPTQGTFGIADARIIAPGTPHRSVLYYRTAKLGGGRMPKLGTSEVDAVGVRLLSAWIRQLGVANAEPGVAAADVPPADAAALQALAQGGSDERRAAALGQLTSSTRGALALAARIDSGDLPPATRRAVLAATAKAPSEIRDLFERFAPAPQRARRLGTVVNQEEILQLPGDPQSGRQVFFANATIACKNCHRIQGDATAGETEKMLGPDLTQIGKKYRPQELLEHLLAPSKKIDPPYVPYLLETTDGRVVSGLLETESDQQVVLRDAKNQRHQFARDVIQRMVRRRKSLMPDLLLQDLTRQEVADLVAYLASLK